MKNAKLALTKENSHAKIQTIGRYLNYKEAKMQKKYNPTQTIEKILSISGELFLTKGYDKTSMQDIVNELGMSKGAIFHHFKSKDEIFETVTVKMAEEQVARYKDMLSIEMKGLSAKEKLIGMFRKSLLVDENLVSKMLTPRIKDPKIVMGMVKFNMETSAPLIADIIKEGLKDGSINTDYPEECAQVVLMLLNTWCDPIIFECDVPTLRRRFEYLQHLMKVSGVDIISDDLIEDSIKFTEKIYEVQNGIN